MIAGLQRLLVELREEGLAVSPAEWIDAMRAVEHVGVSERGVLRAALGATLAKRVSHREVFDRVFDRVFVAPARGVRKKKGQRGGVGAASERPSQVTRGLGKGKTVRPETRSLARFARLGPGSGSRPGRLRKVILAPPENREAERARAHGMAVRPGPTALRPPRRVVALDSERELAREIPRLVEQIRLRTGRRHARAARGRLDLRRTFRENLASSGVPFVLPRRRPRPKRSRLWLLVDVSWSTAAAAGLFLSVAAEFLVRRADTRVFLFVDRAVEAGSAIERWWAARPGAPARTVSRPGFAIARGGLSFAELVGSVPGLVLDAPSDYGRMFSGLLRQDRGRPTGRGTLLVVLGDGRSNLNDPQAWAFEELARGAGAVLWLVPEPLSRWAEGDSALEQYLPHADVAVEARDAEGLARGVAEIVGQARSVTDLRPGSVVAWWDGRRLAFAVLADVDGSRVRLVVGKGAEARVAASRIAVAVEPPGKVPARTPDDLRAAGKRATEAGARVRERAPGIDVAVLWDIVGPGASHEEMAELALGDRGGEAVAVLLVALETEGLHFERRGEGFVPRGRAEVEELLRQRETAARREAERFAFFDALRALVAGKPHVASDSETERRHLAALESLAVHEEQTPEAARVLALGALAESGVGYERPHEGAFKLLRLWGRFASDDENLQLARVGLAAEFPPEVLARAREVAVRGFERAGRERLEAQPALSVDSAATTEIDDVLTVEERASGFTLGIHIADPAAFVERDDAVDREALERGLTWYLTEGKVLMLPAPLSEEAASLRQGQERPALSFTVSLDREGRIEDYGVARSIVRSELRLDYAAADRAIASGEGPGAAALGALFRAAEARERERLRAGAIVLRPAEVLPRLGPDGRVVLDSSPADSPSRRAVAEAMVLAGEVAARILVEGHLAAAFRRQAPLPASVARPAGPVSDPVQMRALRRALRRAEIGLEPAPHAGLGLAAYVQISSPLRRYQDLAGHRQLLAVLGQEVPYTTQEMQRIAASTERREADARRAERATVEFWLLRWLEERAAEEHAGVIVETEPRPFVQLDETLLEVAAPALAGAALGERVRVRVERVNPRAGVLVVRRA